MRIAVLGGGAMGSVFAAALSEHGTDVTIVDINHELVARLDADGLRLIENGEERRVALGATSDPSGLGVVDAVLVFVKCMHTAAAAELARPLVGDATAVVTLQNGWGNGEVLERAFGGKRLAIGVTYTSATVTGTGTVRSSGPARTIIGDYVAGSGAAAPVAAELAAAGFAVEQPEDIRSRVWEKLVLNAATLPTAALTGLSAGALCGEGAMRALVDAAATEAVRVGIAQGFSVDLEERLRSIQEVCERAGDGKASMLQDVEAGRPTEIDVISGAVIRVADERGVEVPVTRSLDALVRGLQAAR